MIVCSFPFLVGYINKITNMTKPKIYQQVCEGYYRVLRRVITYDAHVTKISYTKTYKKLFSLHLNPKLITLSFAKSWWQRWWTSFMESWSVETLMCIKLQPTFHCPNPHYFTKSRLLMMKMTNYDSQKTSWISHSRVKIQGTQYMMHIS